MKIKKCPKCGSKGKLHSYDSAVYPPIYFVMCENLFCNHFTKNCDTEKEAIEQWDNLE